MSSEAEKQIDAMGTMYILCESISYNLPTFTLSALQFIKITQHDI